MQHDPRQHMGEQLKEGTGRPVEPVLPQHTRGNQDLGQRFRERSLGHLHHGSAADNERLELVVNTVALRGAGGNNLAEVAHDARNMVTALGLYCELLQEPGVLTETFQHYAGELRLVTAASRRLVDKLATIDKRMLALALDRSQSPLVEALLSATVKGKESSELAPSQPVDNLAAEVCGLRTLLTALAGTAVKLETISEGGESAVHLTGDDLTRILVNLVKNAAEAMHEGGRIWIRTGVAGHIAGVPTVVRLSVEDEGPGIPAELMDRVFEAGFTTHPGGAAETGGARGLGLSITRSLVEGVGGTIHAARRTPTGTTIQIHLPVRGR